MNKQIASVLARYEERSRQEYPVVAAFSMQEYVAQRDGFLLDIGPESAKFLNILIKATRPKLVLEIGSSYGFSTLWLAEAADAAGARVVSLEISEQKIRFAKQQIDEAGLGSVVQFIQGDALTNIASMTDPVDFVLIDLWKELYIPVLDGLYPKLAREALIAADNICLPAIHAPVMQKYVAHVRSLPGIESVTVPVGSGIELSRYSKDRE